MTVIYKICSRALWVEAEKAGVFKGAPVDLADGYIHFSTAGQVRQTAEKYFAGMADLLLVAIEADHLGEALRWEPARGGDLFPHLYAPLPIKAALWVKPLYTDAGGKHIFPELG